MATPRVEVPDLLTASRIPLAGVPWIAPESAPLLVIALFLAGLTDVLDGWLARRIRAKRLAAGEPPGRLATRDAPGALLDPVADKLFAVSVLVLLWTAADVPISLLLLVALRELAQVPMALTYWIVPPLRRRLRFDFRAGIPGKVTTIFQFLAVIALRFSHPTGPWLAGLAALAGVGSAMHYVRRAVTLAREQSDAAENGSSQGRP